MSDYTVTLSNGNSIEFDDMIELETELAEMELDLDSDEYQNAISFTANDGYEYQDQFNAERIDTTDIETWLDWINRDEYERVAFLISLNDLGLSVNDMSDYRVGEMMLFKGTAIEQCQEYIDDCYSIPEPICNYIDYEKFAHDCIAGGDISEYEDGYQTWTYSNH